MLKKITRREFVTGLTATLLCPKIAIASSRLYSYNTPMSREDLYDIPENHLLARAIFGEAGNCVYHEQLAVGYTAINRLFDNKKYNGENSLTDVLLKKYRGNHQYDCFRDDSKNERIMANFQRTLNPAKYDLKTWEKCLVTADEVIKGKFQNLNQDQTSYVVKKQAEKLKKSEYSNWFKDSVPVKIVSPNFYLFKHEFVRDP